MKSATKKLIMYIIPVLCTGFIFAIYSPFKSGKETIQILMNEALNETITVDYHRRDNMETKHINMPLNRKVKGVKIVSKDGSETIEFTDSIEEYLANQWVVQYILADIHPVNPNEFNAIFKEELNKKGITCRTGIIYRHNKKPQYSDKDSVTFQKAIITKPVTLDIKNTVSVQAWAMIHWTEIAKHTAPEVLWSIIAYFIVLSWVSFSSLKKTQKKEIPVSRDCIQLGKMTLKPESKKLYINGQPCPMAPADFNLLVLFLNAPRHLLTKEDIKNAFWPKDDKPDNKIYTHIATLKSSLKSFPGYQITADHKKGYQLVIPPNEASV